MGTLGNTPRQHTTLTLEARKSYAFGVKFLHRSSKQPVDITGAMVRFTSSYAGEQVLDVDAEILDAELGLAQVNLQAAQLDLPVREYPFTLTLVSATGYSTVVAKGTLDLQENTEAESTLSTYLPHNPSTNLAAYLEGGDVVQVHVDQVDGLTVIVKDLLEDYKDEHAAAVAQFLTALDALRDTTDGFRILAGFAADSAAASATAAAASATSAAASVALAANQYLGSGSVAERPSATGRPAGQMYFNEETTRPNWTDGLGSWRDATGAAV